MIYVYYLVVFLVIGLNLYDWLSPKRRKERKEIDWIVHRLTDQIAYEKKNNVRVTNTKDGRRIH